MARSASGGFGAMAFCHLTKGSSYDNNQLLKIADTLPGDTEQWLAARIA
jgi:hypothetical protein